MDVQLLALHDPGTPAFTVTTPMHPHCIAPNQVMEVTDFPADVQKRFQEQIAEGGFKLGQQ